MKRKKYYITLHEDDERKCINDDSSVEVYNGSGASNKNTKNNEITNYMHLTKKM